MACIPAGGHCIPNSTVGDKELWKYVQKIPIKNNVSETINKAIPINKPLCTAKVWLPKYVDSIVISLNQKNIILSKQLNEANKNEIVLVKACIANVPVYAMLNKDILDITGQGEGKTKWKGWAWNKLLLIIIINY